MTELTFLQILAFIFMTYEFIKVFFIPKNFWSHIKFIWFEQNKSEDVIEGKKNLLLSYIGYIYIAFILLLLFSQWWWISLSFIGLSMITFRVLLPLIKNNESFSSKIFYIFLIDFAFTILLLWQVVNPIKLLQNF